MVIRVAKTKNYTVMCNHHLRNRQLSLAAKGLMSYMLSCSDSWQHSERSLAAMHGCGRQKIRTALKELEMAGYLARQQGRDDKGRMAHIEYILYEQPPRASIDDVQENEPWSEKPTTGKPTAENHTIRNTNRKKYQNNNIITARTTKNAEAIVEQYQLAANCVPVVAGYIANYGLELVSQAVPYSKSRAKTNLMGYLHTVLEHGAILPEPHMDDRLEYVPVSAEIEPLQDFRQLSPKIRMFAEKHVAQQKDNAGCERS